MEFIGRVIKVLPAVEVGHSKTKKKSIAVIEDDATHPESMLVDFFAENADKLYNVKEGDIVSLTVRHILHDKDDKMFNNIRASDIQVLPQ